MQILLLGQEERQAGGTWIAIEAIFTFGGRWGGDTVESRGRRGVKNGSAFSVKATFQIGEKLPEAELSYLDKDNNVRSLLGNFYPVTWLWQGGLCSLVSSVLWNSCDSVGWLEVYGLRSGGLSPKSEKAMIGRGWSSRGFLSIRVLSLVLVWFSVILN
ncbi:hypothetical protein R1sor_014739 [Riccia sorocarpa]|uniref:Uncharacterized protein n=1 Tax=Riccia sorocarpa TaxID=122646 RepID=A0ABD3HE37_9MARC